MENRNRNAAGAGTPCGGCVNYLPLDYSIGDGREQLKIQKAMWLFELCMKINSTEKRDRAVTGDLPTTFVTFNGHVANIRIEIFMHGWEKDEVADKAFDLWMNSPDYSEVCTEAFRYLTKLKWELEVRDAGV